MRLLAVFLLLAAVSAYEELNEKRQYDYFLELNSEFPVFHLYHNRHFGKSRQYQDFLEVLEDTELRTRDYAKIIITDCEKVKKGQFDVCQNIAANNENRAIHGLTPSSKLLKMGSKKLQQAPGHKTFRHPSDVYTVDEIVEFIEGLLPVFITPVATTRDLEEFLKPRYSPKLLYFTKEEDAPRNIAKLTVYFNLRIDFAFIEDLSEELVQRYHVTKFPLLLALVYNYTTGVFDEHPYDGPQFDSSGYFRMKEFLKQYALPEKRIDLMFHNIKRPTRNDRVVVDNDQDLWRELDKTPGWTIIEYSRDPIKLPLYEAENGLFLSYIHYKVGLDETPKIMNYLPRTNQSRAAPQTFNGKISVQTIDAESALSNASALVAEDYTVLLVREKYGYICPITEQSFFRELVFCIVLDEEEYGKFKARIGKDMEIGFICSQGASPGSFSAQPVKEVEFDKLYMQLEYNVKMKLSELMKDYFTNPIKEFKDKRPIGLLCRDPHKMCVLAFLNSQKPEAMRTELEYLKDAASEYFSEFKFFWVEDSCNTELKNAISEPKMTMLLYDPRTQHYAAMRNRISKTIVVKFLKMARRSDLPMKPFSNILLDVNSCRQQVEPQPVPEPVPEAEPKPETVEL